jgi:TPR repeat protein
VAVWSRLVSLALAIFLMSVDASAWADCNAGWGAIRSEHLEQALRELLPCPEAGDPRAQFMIGVMYDLGKGTSENNTEAARWSQPGCRHPSEPAGKNWREIGDLRPPQTRPVSQLTSHKRAPAC